MPNPTLDQHLYNHRYLFFFVTAYAVVITALTYIYGGETENAVGIVLSFLPLSFSMVLFVVLIIAWHLALSLTSVIKDKKPITSTFRVFDDRLSKYWKAGFLYAGIAAILARLPLDLIFSVAKSLIPQINPYSWDPVFAKMDHVLHFGQYPHEWLMPVVNALGALQFLDQFYISWFLIVTMAYGFCFFADPDPLRRMRFLWAGALCWVFLGTFSAVAFSSVGPIFYGEFFGDAQSDPYATFVTQLKIQGEAHGLNSYTVSQMLFDMYKDGDVININAISAMPSLHVAIMALVTYYMWSTNRFLGVLSVICLILIFTGSIVLGWHYAVDGYFGMIGAWVMWMIGKPLTQKLHPEWCIVQDTD